MPCIAFYSVVQLDNGHKVVQFVATIGQCVALQCIVLLALTSLTLTLTIGHCVAVHSLSLLAEHSVE